MDYEKKYNEALKGVRRLHDRMKFLSSTDALVASSELEFIFPELAESEDERIRKQLIEYHKQQFENNRDQEVGLFHKDALAWLEKQKEQKPEEKSEKPIIPEWSEEALNVMNLVYRCIRKVLAEFAVYTENEELLESREETVCYYSQRCAEKILKSLRPQYHGDVTMTEAYKMGLEAGKLSSWKPSEHQMNILKAVKEYVGRGSGYWGEGLGSLIEDLEKL